MELGFGGGYKKKIKRESLLFSVGCPEDHDAVKSYAQARAIRATPLGNPAFVPVGRGSSSLPDCSLGLRLLSDGGGHPQVVLLWNPASVGVSGGSRGDRGPSRGAGSGRRPNPPTGSKHGGTTMKMVKSAFLASAAGLVAMSGAQAADLPVKAKPVEYVKVCSLYGAGFYYIPGTDICMKVGGYVRWQESWNPGSSISGGPFDGHRRPRDPDRLAGLRAAHPRRGDVRHPPADRVRHAPHVPADGLQPGLRRSAPADRAGRVHDPRLHPDRGLHVRQGDVVLRLRLDRGGGLQRRHAPQLGHRRRRPDGCGLHRAVRQRPVGHDLGRADPPRGDRRPAAPAPRSAWSTLGRPTCNNCAGISGGTTCNVGQQDIVGNIRIDQAWGSAQISGAVHDVSAGYYTGVPGAANVEASGHPSNKWGWAVSAGLRLNAPMIGPGDYFQAQVIYSRRCDAAMLSQTPRGAALEQVGRQHGRLRLLDGRRVTPRDGRRHRRQHRADHRLERVRVVRALLDAGSAYVALRHRTSTSSHNGAANGGDLRAPQTGDHQRRSRAVRAATRTGARGAVGSRSQWNITKDLYVGLDVIYHEAELGRPTRDTAAQPGGRRRRQVRDRGTYTVGGPGRLGRHVAYPSRHRSLMIA